MRVAQHLPPHRLAELDAIPGWVWHENDARWQRGLNALARFRTEHGHAQVPATYRTPSGFALGEWCSGRRGEYKRGTLTDTKRTTLEGVEGWTWTAQQGRRLRGWALVREFADQPATHSSRTTCSCPTATH
ncbi:helicase associated domain-containing protein [Streptacidiphilus sp. EB129]|uniref:helicase associated domain-containing protein n=1 Tax=Streptacidiphilus sp. EB129 TaxID=3156262 RepID=UPI003515B9D9